MKKTTAIILILVISMTTLLVFPSLALSEEKPLHLLWNIPFEDDVKKVQTLLKENKGLDSEYKEYESAFGYEHRSVKVALNPETTLFGYPFELTYSTSNEKDSLDLSSKYFLLLFISENTSEKKLEQCTAILNGLIDKYGEPTAATMELYNQGMQDWYDKSLDSIHEIIALDTGGTMRDMNVSDLVSNWEHSTNETTTMFNIYIDNISFKFYYVHDTTLETMGLIDVTFNSSPKEPDEAIFEKIAPTLYADEGF